jgi:hypothetical protein
MGRLNSTRTVSNQGYSNLSKLSHTKIDQIIKVVNHVLHNIFKNLSPEYLWV